MCLKLNLLPLPFFTVRKTTPNIIPQSSLLPMRYGNRVHLQNIRNRFTQIESGT